jgi:hypothetical protein
MDIPDLRRYSARAACGAPQAPQLDDIHGKTEAYIHDRAQDIEGMIEHGSARQRRQIDLRTQ